LLPNVIALALGPLRFASLALQPWQLVRPGEKQKPAPYEQTFCPEWALVASSDAGF